jgi:AcrR family transcriptional regulator
MSVTQELAARRPHRSDAARNFDAILTAARTAFTDHGPQASLDDIAQAAGVGVATLYRNFPSRGDLVEAVYAAEVDDLCRYGQRLLRTEPWQALVAWLRRFDSYLTTKRQLGDALDRETGDFRASRDALYTTGQQLLDRARDAGRVRVEVSVDDLLRFFLGVATVPCRSKRQRERILALAIHALEP